MRIEPDLKLDFVDVLIHPKRSTITSRSEVDLTRTLRFKHCEKEWTGIPVMSANMTTVTTPAMVKILAEHQMLACLPKNSSFEEIAKITNYWNVAIPSVGIQEKETDDIIDRISKQIPNSDFICIDVANGYMEKLVEFIKRLREKLPLTIIIAGNVVSAEMTESLILAGADVVKVGLGSGAACTTRIMAGVGYPQLSAVIECADAAHGLGGHIVSDGGCVNPGDIAKAFGAGADFVMLGGMLAGHDESGGEIVERNGEKFVHFYGMSSRVANECHAGGLKDYRAAEGRELYIPYRGKVADTLQAIEGGLRSACAYVGASKLKDLPKRTTFVQVNRQTNTSLL